MVDWLISITNQPVNQSTLRFVPGRREGKYSRSHHPQRIRHRPILPRMEEEGGDADSEEGQKSW
jgi:hypothetical protein